MRGDAGLWLVPLLACTPAAPVGNFRKAEGKEKEQGGSWRAAGAMRRACSPAACCCVCLTTPTNDGETPRDSICGVCRAGRNFALAAAACLPCLRGTLRRRRALGYGCVFNGCTRRSMAAAHALADGRSRRKYRFSSATTLYLFSTIAADADMVDFSAACRCGSAAPSVNLRGFLRAAARLLPASFCCPQAASRSAARGLRALLLLALRRAAQPGGTRSATLAAFCPLFLYFRAGTFEGRNGTGTGLAWRGGGCRRRVAGLRRFSAAPSFSFADAA